MKFPKNGFNKISSTKLNAIPLVFSKISHRPQSANISRRSEISEQRAANELSIRLNVDASRASHSRSLFQLKRSHRCTKGSHELVPRKKSRARM